LIFELDYHNESAIERTFYRVGTTEGLREQTKPKNISSFTIVAYIRKQDQKTFQDIINRIRESGHQFRGSLNWHCTLLSLDRKVKGNTNQYDLAFVYRDVKDFFKNRKLGHLEVHFDIIHPGKDKNDLKSSDGTVIALAREGHSYNERFLKIIRELNDYLNEQGYLNTIASRRVENTIWCTLGFFNEKPFEVDASIYETFNAQELRQFCATVTFNEIAITEYRLKSLDDGIVRYKIQL
jgi:hypothetical protein